MGKMAVFSGSPETVKGRKRRRARGVDGGRGSAHQQSSLQSCGPLDHSRHLQGSGSQLPQSELCFCWGGNHIHVNIFHIVYIVDDIHMHSKVWGW